MTCTDEHEWLNQHHTNQQRKISSYSTSKLEKKLINSLRGHLKTQKCHIKMGFQTLHMVSSVFKETAVQVDAGGCLREVRHIHLSTCKYKPNGHQLQIMH